ncbi:transcription initiation factor TFIID subunit 3 [Hyalella azteca]|uniref:Transcription initiation factor TFIID subunit 3 n=1 Tax=Hyalella azteca TaxID=294128 RepID=A0A979FLU2_HYAAZ|nr:transcription initiation factor TFIID subunit 3 [Hyalella azteca]
MMTTSGFISSAREGKLPEARMPHIPLPVIPHQTPTSRSSGGANSRNPSSTSAQSLAQTIAAKKKMSLERLMRHKHNMALKRAAQNTLNGLNNVNTSTPKTKSSKKSLSHSAVLSLAGAAVDSSLCFTTKHGKPKEKLKPKIPATPPGTSRFLTPSTPHLLAKKPGSAAGTPLGPPPKLKIPTPRQKQPEFSTDVLPLPKEDPKELEERELQLQRKKEKQKELARAARSGLLGAIVGSGGGHLMDASDEGGQTFNGVVAPETKTSKMPTSSSLLSNALKTKKEKKDREEKKDLKKISKEGRKDKDKKDKSDSKKDKLIKKKEEKERRDKKDLKKKEKDGSKKLKDSSKKDTKKDKEKKSKEGKIKLKEKKDKKLKKVSDASTIKSPRSTIASLDTSEISRPHSPSLTDASTIASLDVSSGFSPDASKSKLCVFKKSNKTHTKADSLSDDPFTSKPNVCIEDSYNTADASADMSGVLSSPSISASPLDVPGKIVKQKKRKRLLDDDSESPGDALSPKMKKSKSSPRAKSTKMSIDINAISGALDDNALPFTSSSCPMSSWDGRPSTPSGVHDFSTVKYPPTPSLYPQAPGLYPPAPGLYPPAPSLYPPAPSLYPPTPGLYPPTPGLYPHSFSSNTNAFSPLSCGTPDGFLEQTERPLTPGKARTPERSSRGVTPSGSFMPSGALCSDTPHSATSSSGPSPSPPEGEHSAGPHSPLDVASSNAFNFAGDSERKKKDKEHRKEKKEKDKIKKKKDKKLKEKLEKKQKEKLEKKEKKKKKSLEGGELGDVLLLQQTHLETPTPVAPKLTKPIAVSASCRSPSIHSDPDIKLVYDGGRSAVRPSPGRKMSKSSAGPAEGVVSFVITDGSPLPGPSSAELSRGRISGRRGRPRKQARPKHQLHPHTTIGVIKRSEPHDSSLSSFSVTSSIPTGRASPSPPPAAPLTRDDQPGSPELAKISALITRPPKLHGGSSSKDKGRNSAHRESPPLVHKETKPSKDRATPPPDAGLRVVPPLKIKSAVVDDKVAAATKKPASVPSPSPRGVSSSKSSSGLITTTITKSSSGLITTTIASVPVLPAAPPPLPEPLAAPVVADAISSLGHFVDDQGNEVWICPTCGKQDDGSPMIGCDTCDDWYHWVCVGIQVPPNEAENWYCPRCLAQHKQRNLPGNPRREKKKHHHGRRK